MLLLALLTASVLVEKAVAFFDDEGDDGTCGWEEIQNGCEQECIGMGINHRCECKCPETTADPCSLSISCWGKLDKATADAIEANLNKGKYFGDPELKNEPRERKTSIDGDWDAYGKYHLTEEIPTKEDCDGQWVFTEIMGYLNMNWYQLDAWRACDGVHPIKYKSYGRARKIKFCCPDYPFTKLAGKCDRKNQNHMCVKNANAWKGNGKCHLKECGNCPSMWDKNVFDGGDCGFVKYKSSMGETGAVAHALAMTKPEPQDQPSTFVQVFALLGLGSMLYGAARFYLNK